MDIIGKWCAEKNNVTCITQKNRGVSSARNVGIGIAQGEYIWFVDSDDTVHADNALRFVKRAPKDDLIWFSYENNICGDTGGQTLEEDGLRSRVNCSEGSYSISKYVNKYYYGAGMLWAYWLKKSIIDKNGLKFNEKACWFEDANFLMHYICYAESIWITPSVLYAYRIHENGAMRNSDIEDRHKCSLMLNAELTEFLGRVDASNEIKDGIQKFLSISTAWCIREANDSYAYDLYLYCKGRGMFPLPVSGSWKQKMQIATLNVNYKLYRLLCKFI